MASAKRWFPAMILALTVLLAAGCRSEITDTQTVLKDGRLYRIGDATPYTGRVTGTEKTGAHETLRFVKSYEAGQLQGDSYYYYANGNIARKEPYRNGKVNGIASYYYESGRIRARVHLVDGLRGGEHGEAHFPDAHLRPFGL